VNWKTDLKLADLDRRQAIEVTCRACGQTRTDTAGVLMALPGLKQAYLDEVERDLRCSSRFCRGPVRIAMIHDEKNEGFVGGMA
jgi:hypothetical protein